MDGVAASLAATSGKFGVQGVETLRPQGAVAIDPAGGLIQGSWHQAVDPASPLRLRLDDARLTQRSELIGHPRLTDPELARDDLPQVTGSTFPLCQHFDHSATHRIGEQGEDVHLP